MKTNEFNSDAAKSVIRASLDFTIDLWIKPVIDIIEMVNIDNLVDEHDPCDLDTAIQMLRTAICEIESVADTFRNEEDLQ